MSAYLCALRRIQGPKRNARPFVGATVTTSDASARRRELRCPRKHALDPLERDRARLRDVVAGRDRPLRPHRAERSARRRWSSAWHERCTHVEYVSSGRAKSWEVASGQAWLCLWPAHGAGSRPRPHPELPYLFGISTVSSEQQRPRVRPPAHCRRPQLIGRRFWRAQGPLPPSPPPPGPRSPPTPRPF